MLDAIKGTRHIPAPRNLGQAHKADTAEQAIFSVSKRRIDNHGAGNGEA